MVESIRCSSGTYLSSLDNQCHLCTAGCVECVEQRCTRCLPQLQLTTSGLCEVSNTNFNGTCHPNCLTCYHTRVDTCLSCKPNYTENEVLFRNFTSCIKVNYEGSNIFKVLNRSKVCTQNYVLNDQGYCDLCPANCSTCKLNSNKDLKFNYLCTSCWNNYHLDETSSTCVLNLEEENSFNQTKVNSLPDPSQFDGSTQWQLPLLIIVLSLFALVGVLFFYRKVSKTYRKVNTQRKVAEYRGNLLKNLKNQNLPSQDSSSSIGNLNRVQDTSLL